MGRASSTGEALAMWFWANVSFSAISAARPKESVCMSLVSITCSGGGERWRCLRRRKKRAAKARMAAKARAPMAMPTFAPVESPWEEDMEERSEVEAGTMVVVVVDDGVTVVTAVSEEVVAAGGDAPEIESVVTTPGTVTVGEKAVIVVIVVSVASTLFAVLLADVNSPDGDVAVRWRGLSSRCLNNWPPFGPTFWKNGP